MTSRARAVGRFHTARLRVRKSALEKVFSTKKMEYVWGKYVRDGLRKQEILDLHDYLDFHSDRSAIFLSLNNQINEGLYAPQKSLPVRIEKKNGVTRALVVPSPEDAVVLQCLVEAIYPHAKAKQPSENSFFSRSHGFAGPALQFHTDYIWFRRWRTFSKIRLEMVSTHQFICVTDIANYFDNIDYRHLRNVITTLDAFDEVILDILFLILDTISWRPDYLPSPGKSLPQVNFDAPRLLSHIFLFEIDEFLRSRTNDSFVRWVDDITVAVSSRSDGKEILRDLDELLMTRGLRLNSGKTAILSASEAAKFFWASENKYLDAQKNRIDESKTPKRTIAAVSRLLRSRFDSLYLDRGNRHGQKDKILKRYLSLFTQMKDSHILQYSKNILEQEPGLRDGLWRYFLAIGPNAQVLRMVRDYLLGGHALDDASIFHAVKMLISWSVAPNSRLHRNLQLLGIKLGADQYVNRSPLFFLASLWLLGKYGRRSHIYSLVEYHSDLWKTSSFLSRQVASIIPKFRDHSMEMPIRDLIERHKQPAANSVLKNLDNIRGAGPGVPKALRLYVLNGNNKGGYSLPRFLICLHVLLATGIPVAVRVTLRDDIIRMNTDPIYNFVLNSLKFT